MIEISSPRDGSTTLHAIPIGEALVRGPEVYRAAAFDEWVPLTFYVWLVRTQSAVVLIDTGITPDAQWWHERAQAIRGPEAYWRPSIYADPNRALAPFGLTPEQVDHVVLTSFGPYACSNVAMFPAAEVHVSARGLRVLREHTYPSLEPTLPSAARSLLLDGADEARLRGFTGEIDIVPGVRAREIGGHHAESLAVVIEDGVDTAVVAESVFVTANLEPERVLGLAEDVYAVLDTLRWIADTANIVLPIHDPRILERYPGGQVFGPAAGAAL